jgi:hypothetical protein
VVERRRPLEQIALTDLHTSTAGLVQGQGEIQGRAVAIAELLVHRGDRSSMLVEGIKT